MLLMFLAQIGILVVRGILKSRKIDEAAKVAKRQATIR
jgi:hypothetical protein